jgi:hypothetical protein
MTKRTRLLEAAIRSVLRGILQRGASERDVSYLVDGLEERGYQITTRIQACEWHCPPDCGDPRWVR